MEKLWWIVISEVGQVKKIFLNMLILNKLGKLSESLI